MGRAGLPLPPGVRTNRNSECGLPVVWQPTSIGTFGASAGTLINARIGGYAANALGWLSPEDWYLTK